METTIKMEEKNASSSSIQGLQSPNQEELEEDFNDRSSISNRCLTTEERDKYTEQFTNDITDKYTERFLSPSQMDEEEEDSIQPDLIYPRQMEDDDKYNLSLGQQNEHEQLLSLYEAVKEEGYAIPPTSSFEENSKICQVYICSEDGCNSRFSKRAYLEQHMCIHTSERPFVCANEGCNKTYKRKDHLNRHAKYCPLSPDGGLPPVICTVEGCDRTFINDTNLRKHIQVYHENKKKKIQSLIAEYSDVVKSDKYLNNDELEGGEKTQPEIDLSSKTPFGCPHPGCGMSFRWMNRLRRHLKVHEGYTCPECDEKFEKWPQLVKHKTAAHKEPQKCPICERTFAQGQWLKRHMKVHSDVREMYLCPYEDCKRCYSEKRNLDAHIRSYHDKQRFYCVFEDCGRSFAFKHKMLEHLKIHCNITEPMSEDAL